MDTIRNDSIQLLNNIVKNNNKSKKIEESIFEYSKDYCKSELSDIYNDQFLLIYTGKLNNILNNINKQSKIQNKFLLDAIKTNTIDLTNIAFMTSDELNPENWSKLKNIIENRNKLNKNNVSYTNEFDCFKCGKNETFIFQLQTRSGDEAMTTFITCKHCKNSWKDS